MTIAAALYTHLTTDTALNALIEGRLYPVTVPALEPNESGELPQMPPTVAYSLTGRNDDQAFTSHRILTSWDFACIAGNDDSTGGAGYDMAHQVADAVITRLYHFRGVVGDKRIVHALLTNLSDSYEPDLDAFVVTASFDIAYNQVSQ